MLARADRPRYDRSVHSTANPTAAPSATGAARYRGSSRSSTPHVEADVIIEQAVAHLTRRRRWQRALDHGLQWGLPSGLVTVGVAGFWLALPTASAIGGLVLACSLVAGWARPHPRLVVALALDQALLSNEAVLQAIELRNTLGDCAWSLWARQRAAALLRAGSWRDSTGYVWRQRSRDLKRLAGATALSVALFCGAWLHAQAQAQPTSSSTRSVAFDTSLATTSASQPARELVLSSEVRDTLQSMAQAIDHEARIAVEDGRAWLDFGQELQVHAKDGRMAAQELEALASELARLASTLEPTPQSAELDALAPAWQALAEDLRQAGFHELARSLRQGDDLALTQALQNPDAAQQRRLAQAVDQSLARSANALNQTNTSSPDPNEERRLKRPPTAQPSHAQPNASSPQQRAREQLERLRRLQRDMPPAGSGGSSGQTDRSNKPEQHAAQALNDLRKAAQRSQAAARLQRSAATTSETLRRLKQENVKAGEFTTTPADPFGRKNSNQQAKERFARASKGNDRAAGQSGKNQQTMVISDDSNQAQAMVDDPSAEPSGAGEAGNAPEMDEKQFDSPGQANGSALGEEAGSGAGPEGGKDPAFIKRKAQGQALRGTPGQGPSRAQVIESASLFGFGQVAYSDVFVDYSDYAQTAMQRDAVPAAQRQQVFRYFQLIRPRP